MVWLYRGFPPPSAHRLSLTDRPDPSLRSFPVGAFLLPQSGGLRARVLWAESLTRACHRRRLQQQLRAFSAAQVLSSLLQALSFFVFPPGLVPTSASNHRSRLSPRRSLPPGLRGLQFRARRIFCSRLPWCTCLSLVRIAVRLVSTTCQYYCYF